MSLIRVSVSLLLLTCVLCVGCGRQTEVIALSVERMDGGGCAAKVRSARQEVESECESVSVSVLDRNVVVKSNVKSAVRIAARAQARFCAGVVKERR